EQLAQAAKGHGILLKQTYAKEGGELERKAGRYAHAKQYRRMHKTIKRQRTVLGRLARDIARSKTELAQSVQDALDPLLARAHRIAAQSRRKSGVKGKDRIYSWHAPEVECIGKGKAHTPYEFGVKVGIVTTLKGNLIVGARSFPGNPYDGHTLAEAVEQAPEVWGSGEGKAHAPEEGGVKVGLVTTLKGNLIVGARSFPGNPYDGHTLAEALEQATILMEATGVRPKTVYADLGYRGVDGE